MWQTKNAFFSEMQFWSHCYTVVSYQALFRLSLYKILAVYLSGAKMCVFARYATLVPRLISRVFVKTTMSMLMGAFFDKFTGMEVKYKIAVYNKILK